MELISLVLATYGRCDDVGRMLDSLSAQLDKNFEVLVVDQNKDDRLLPHMERAIASGMRIRHLREPVPGLSAARNRGIAEAHGHLLGFPDDDCWYEANTLAEVRRAFQADKGVEGIAGYWVEQLAAKPAGGPSGYFSNKAWSRFQGLHASSITLFFRRSAFERWGDFDSRMGVGQWFGAAEETDLVMRFMAAGARMCYAPKVLVHHAFSARRIAPLVQACAAMRRRGRGTGAIYAKHEMGLWVVCRGLAGQALRPLLAGDWQGALLGICASWGALEGLLRWRSINP